jgi:hypothetical protein
MVFSQLVPAMTTPKKTGSHTQTMTVDRTRTRGRGGPR